MWRAKWIEPPQTRDGERMKRIRIVHKTEYHYNQPVMFGPHRAMLRPREGHDVHSVRGRLEVEPGAVCGTLPETRRSRRSGRGSARRQNNRVPYRADGSRFSVPVCARRAVGTGCLPASQLSYEGPKLQEW